MDISHMLDTTLGEPSPSHPFSNWPAAPDVSASDVPAPVTSQDSSTPGKYFRVISR